MEAEGLTKKDMLNEGSQKIANWFEGRYIGCPMYKCPGKCFTDKEGNPWKGNKRRYPDFVIRSMTDEHTGWEASRDCECAHCVNQSCVKEHQKKKLKPDASKLKARQCFRKKCFALRPKPCGKTNREECHHKKKDAYKAVKECVKACRAD